MEISPSLGSLADLPYLSKVVDEGVVVPHVFLWQVGTPLPILILLLDRVVTQVDRFVEILYFIRLGTESRNKEITDWVLPATSPKSHLRYEDLYIQMTRGFQSVTRTHCLISNFVW